MLIVGIKIDRKFACDMFASCKDTLTVRENTPMSTCEGLLEDMGSTQAMTYGLSIEFEFTTGDPAALQFPLENCCSYPTDPTDPSSGNTSCPCTACSGACFGGQCVDGIKPASRNTSSKPLPADLGAPRHGVMYGFAWPAVVGLYAGVAVVTLAIMVWARRT